MISLPVFLLQGNELFANHDVLKYPLLNPPLNHAWDGSDISVYMLTIIAAYTSAGILHEDVDGDVLAYDVEYPLSVADELWNAASIGLRSGSAVEGSEHRTAFGIRVEESQRGNRCFEGFV